MRIVFAVGGARWRRDNPLILDPEIADLIAPRGASPSDMLDLYAREVKGE